MIVGGNLPPLAQAAALVGVVLLEAIVLYLGYGAIERAVGPTLLERIRNA